jgi:hypothetical protein
MNPNPIYELRRAADIRHISSGAIGSTNGRKFIEESQSHSCSSDEADLLQRLQRHAQFAVEAFLGGDERIKACESAEA